MEGASKMMQLQAQQCQGHWEPEEAREDSSPRAPGGKECGSAGFQPSGAPDCERIKISVVLGCQVCGNLL